MARLAGSLVIGIAMLAVHFAGMAAAHFHDDPALLGTGPSGVPAFLIPTIAIAVVVTVAAFWIGSIVDARLDAALDALRDSEARHRAAIDTMLDAHIIADSRGIIRFANAAAERIFGYAAAEMIGQHIGMLVDKSAVGKPRTADGQPRLPVIAGQRAVFADGARRKDGTAFPLEICISEFEARGERHYSGVIRDLSRSWDTDLQMRRLAAALEHAGEAIAILDAEHVIRYVNPHYERQTGFTAEEVIGRKPGRNVARPEAYDTLWETVERGEVWTGILRSRDIEDRPLEEDVTVTPMRDSRGEIYSYVVVKRDVTEKRAMEAQLQRAQKVEAIGMLAAGIADEIDAPARQLAYSLRLIEEASAQLASSRHDVHHPPASRGA